MATVTTTQRKTASERGRLVECRGQERDRVDFDLESRQRTPVRAHTRPFGSNDEQLRFVHRLTDRRPQKPGLRGKSVDRTIRVSQERIPVDVGNAEPTHYQQIGSVAHQLMPRDRVCHA